MKDQPGFLCPSAQPDWKDAVVIGVVNGTAETPRVANLEAALPVTPALLQLADPVMPTEVFRFAALCAHEGCRHYREGACHLAMKAAMTLAPVVDQLPPCTIRGRCRWFRQEGKDICLRCPQVATDNAYSAEEMRIVADPNVVLE